MKPKSYNLLDKCVADGVSLGLNRAYKYDPNPTKEVIEREVCNSVMNEICEWFDFEELK